MLPPPPDSQRAPWERKQRLLTPRTGAVGVLTIYAVACFLAILALRPFPSERGILTMLAVAPLSASIGAWAGALEDAGNRARAAFAALLLAIGGPFALAAWIPGIAQEQLHPLPGGVDVVVAAAPDRNFDLYLIPDGDPDRTIELTETADQRELNPTLSPDGRSVVYTADAQDGSTDLYLLPLDPAGQPGRPRLLLDGPDDLSDTSWSPDGRTILVRSDREARTVVFRYDVASGELEPFLEDAFNPTWSPDGSMVAFAAFRKDEPENVDLFVVEADGSRRRHVVDTGFDDLFPVWSPDGRRLAFASEAHDGDYDVFVVNLDGSGLAILTADHDGYDTPYLWGPEGDILFLSDRVGGDAVWGYLMEPDGSNVRLFDRL
jgi:Tol biopolymer transport system component